MPMRWQLFNMHWCMQKSKAVATELDKTWLPSSDDKGVDDINDVYDFWD